MKPCLSNTQTHPLLVEGWGSPAHRWLASCAKRHNARVTLRTLRSYLLSLLVSRLATSSRSCTLRDHAMSETQAAKVRSKITRLCVAPRLFFKVLYFIIIIRIEQFCAILGLEENLLEGGVLPALKDSNKATVLLYGKVVAVLRLEGNLVASMALQMEVRVSSLMLTIMKTGVAA